MCWLCSCICKWLDIEVFSDKDKDYKAPSPASSAGDVKEPTHLSERVEDEVPGKVVYLLLHLTFRAWVVLVHEWDQKWTDSGSQRRLHRLTFDLIQLRVKRDIEDITWPRGDTKFLAEYFSTYTRREISYLQRSYNFLFIRELKVISQELKLPINFFETFAESSLLSILSKKTIKMIGHHSRLRDMMGQSYLIYACTRANHSHYSLIHVTFCGSSKHTLLK